MATWLGSVLAERRLHKGRRGARGSGLLRLGRPKRVREGEYECRYEISGFGRVRRRKAFGVDELQAMSLALVALRAELKGLGGNAKWLGQPAYLGLPVMVPAPFPEKFAKRLEGSIERAMERVATSFEREMKQRYERKRPDTQRELWRHLRASLERIRCSPQRLRGCIRQSDLPLFLRAL